MVVFEQIGFWVFLALVYLMVGRQFVKIKARTYDNWEIPKSDWSCYDLFFFPLSTSVGESEYPSTRFGSCDGFYRTFFLFLWPISFVWFVLVVVVYVAAMCVALCVHVCWEIVRDVKAGFRHIVPKPTSD